MFRHFLYTFVSLFSLISPLTLAQTTATVSKAAPSPPAGEPVSRAELLQEIDVKTERVQQFLREQNLAGVLLTRLNNFSWITAGIGDSHIVITSEVGPASLLIMRNGKKYLIANNTEVPHLMQEDLKELGYEPREYNWYESMGTTDRKMEILNALAAGQPLGTDTPYGDLRFIEGEWAPLRYQLTPSEIKKYRWVGQQSAEAVVAVCRQIKPGMTEKQIEVITSHELLSRGLRPTVVLIGTDERVINYYHYPPTDKPLRQYAIVNVCARLWGLTSSVARYVHFGPPPESLKKAMKASATVSARMQESTRPGVRASDLFEKTKAWYSEVGFEGGWKAIHVGGAIGYAEREWVAFSDSKEVVHENQAFAWNPFTIGALSFDTIILHGGRIENITATKNWPTIPVTVGGKTYAMPDILVR